VYISAVAASSGGQLALVRRAIHQSHGLCADDKYCRTRIKATSELKLSVNLTLQRYETVQTISAKHRNKK